MKGLTTNIYGFKNGVRGNRGKEVLSIMTNDLELSLTTNFHQHNIYDSPPLWNATLWHSDKSEDSTGPAEHVAGGDGGRHVENYKKIIVGSALPTILLFSLKTKRLRSPIALEAGILTSALMGRKR